ncbi:MAG: alpha/beta hydrolase [Gammaproteobacteria bacterium]|nr:alpha/beta hydrolase [Gammaproteobacteria bacterium]
MIRGSVRLFGVAPLVVAAVLAAWPGPVVAAPPLRIDLDAFDASRTRVALTSGISLTYVDVGPRDAPVVLLIHGYTSNGRGWVPLLPYLDHSRRYLIPDLRGHGQSSKPDCCYDRTTFAYDLRLLLDALHVERADVVGTSLGSLIAQAFAENWPERTRRLVLQSSSGGPLAACESEPAGEAAFDFRSAILALRDPLDPESPFMIAWYTSTAPVDAEFLRRQRRDAAAIPVRVWLAILDQGLDLSGLQAGLQRIRAPALLIWGAKDNLFGARDRCSLRAGLPQAEVRIFEDLGHNAYWEDPQAVAAVINPFLAAK